jgi:flagellar basal-body rod protein FlgB
MDPISAALIDKALEGLNQRYLFIAQNIANANTPDYRPVRVEFEGALRAAAGRGVSAIDAVEPRVVTEAEDAGPMRLDLELAAAAQTASRYRALVDLMGRQMALHRSVVSGGR